MQLICESFRQPLHCMLEGLRCHDFGGVENIESPWDTYVKLTQSDQEICRRASAAADAGYWYQFPDSLLDECASSMVNEAVNKALISIQH